MAEAVNTGGTQRFVYTSEERPRMSKEEKKGIDEAYEKYYERKRKEKINKWVAWILLILLGIVLIGSYYYFKTLN